MGTARLRSLRPLARCVLALLLALAGCRRDLPPLPAFPEWPDAPPPAARPADPVPALESTAPEGPTTGGALQPSRDGDRVLSGVVLVDPRLDPQGATAAFSVRNDSGLDLPDLILAVVFAVPSGDPGAPLVPRFETVEAPLARGEARALAVTLGARAPGEVPASFRVVAGLPEVLASPSGDLSGTTFLGGLLECVELRADLTGQAPSVSVGLTGRGAAADDAFLPALEGQLLAARAGSLVWTGPWIVLPRSDPDGGTVRRIRWNLPEVAGLAGSHLYLRVRERR